MGEMLLQRWDVAEGRIENLTGFGYDLAELAADNVELVVDAHGFGWTDGGCYMFAQALQQWSRGQLVIEAIAYEDDGHQAVDHAVCSWTCPDTGMKIYADADGICTSDDLLDRWSEIERRDDRWLGAMPSLDVDLFQDACISLQLARVIESKFGQFDPDVLFAGALEEMIAANSLEDKNVSGMTRPQKMM